MSRRKTVTPSNISFSPVEVKTLDSHLSNIIFEGLKTYYLNLPEDYYPPSPKVDSAHAWRQMVLRMMYAFEHQEKTRNDFRYQADWDFCKLQRKLGWKLFKKHFRNLNF